MKKYIIVTGGAGFVGSNLIEYLLKNNLQLKAFNLCAHEAGAVEEEKTKFTELLAEEKNTNPNAATYTIKLNDKSIGLIRSFNLFE